MEIVHLDFPSFLGGLGCGQAATRSVHVGEDAVGHALAVLLPGQAVLPPALVLITGLSMDKQRGEVEDVEVRQEVVKACREHSGYMIPLISHNALRAKVCQIQTKPSITVSFEKLPQDIPNSLRR